MLYEAFKARPLDFIVKPFTKQQIVDVMEYAIKLAE